MADYSSKENPAPSDRSGQEIYAGFGVRLAAMLIDGVILAFVLGGVILLLGNRLLGSASAMMPDGSPSPEAISASLTEMGICSVIHFAFIAGFLASRWQATPGKRLMGIYVGDLEGARLTFAHALGRELAKVPSWMTLGVGFLIVLFTDQKKALHDVIANTRVFHGRMGRDHVPQAA